MVKRWEPDDDGRPMVRPILIRTLLLAGCALLSSAVAAQSPGPRRLDRLALNPSLQGSVVLGSGRLLPPKDLRLLGVMDYAHNPLLALDQDGRLGAVLRHRLTLHLAAAFAVRPKLELGLQVPVVLAQGGDDLSLAGVPSPAVAGLGVPIASVRYLIWSAPGESVGDDVPLSVSGDLGVGLPVGSAKALAQEPGLSFAPKVIATRSFAGVLASAEAGVALYPLIPFDGGSVGAELSLGAGASRRFREKWSGEASVRAALPFGGSPARGELLLGGRYQLAPLTEVFSLVGPGFGRSPGTPAFRFLAGVSIGRSQ